MPPAFAGEKAAYLPELALKLGLDPVVQFGGKRSISSFAAGEMMASNVLCKGHTAGMGMTISTKS